MLVNIIETFDEGGIRWFAGDNPDVARDVAARWIADGKATADADGAQDQRLTAAQVQAVQQLTIPGDDDRSFLSTLVIVRSGMTAAEINTAISTALGASTIGGEIVFLPGTHSLNASIFFPHNASVRFRPGAIIKPVSGGTYTAGAMFLCNTTNGTSWVVSNPNIRGTVFDGCRFDNSDAPSIQVGMLIAGAPILISNCQSIFSWFYAKTTGNYIDQFVIQHGMSSYPRGANYQVELSNLSDGVRISMAFFGDNGDDVLGVKLTACQGGCIDSCVQGRILLTDSRNVSISNRHGENCGDIELKNSDAVLDNCFFWRMTTPRVKITGAATGRRTVVMRKCLFVHMLGSGSDYTPGFDVQTRSGVDLVIDNCLGVVSQNGGLDESQQHAIRICQDDGSTEVAAFANYAAILTRRCTLKGYELVPEKHSAWFGSGSVGTWPTLLSTNKTPWRAASGTYYYHAALIFDRVRGLGVLNTGTERSIAVTNGGNGVLLPNISPSPRGVAGCFIRVYRGTSAGVYSDYVDLPLVNALYGYDDGVRLNGYAWLSRTPGARDTFTDVRGFDLLPSGNVVVYSNNVPAGGSFTQGDAWQNATPTAAGSYLAAYTGSAWKVGATLAA